MSPHPASPVPAPAPEDAPPGPPPEGSALSLPATGAPSSPTPSTSQRAADFAKLVEVGRQSPQADAPWVELCVGPDVAKAFNYALALLRCGVRVLPLDGVGGLQAPESLRAQVSSCGLVLTGGGDIDPQLLGQPAHPGLGISGVLTERDLAERAWFWQAWQAQRPILAICRGMQLMNWCLGGSLWLDIDSELPLADFGWHPQGDLRREHAPVRPSAGWGHRQIERGLSKSDIGHAIELVPGSGIARAYGTTRIGVNSDHHQALRAVASPLRVTAWAEDGIIEGVEASCQPALGVQFHPELMWQGDPQHLAVFAAFAETARAWAKRG
jgi:putative glutamine amidotransferase